MQNGFAKLSNSSQKSARSRQQVPKYFPMQRFIFIPCHGSMKRILVLTGFFIFISIFISCKKEKLHSFDCSDFQKGIISDSASLVKNEINKICSRLTEPTTRQKLEKLSETISSKCNITATVLCSECIYTLPAQSEIRVTFSERGIQYSKVIDIISRNPLAFAGMHD